MTCSSVLVSDQIQKSAFHILYSCPPGNEVGYSEKQIQALVPVNGTSVPSSSRCWWRMMLCHWSPNAVLKQEQCSWFSVFCLLYIVCVRAFPSRSWLLSSPLGDGNGWSWFCWKMNLSLLSCHFILTVGWVKSQIEWFAPRKFASLITVHSHLQSTDPISRSVNQVGLGLNRHSAGLSQVFFFSL